jgi:hypothetical protein
LDNPPGNANSNPVGHLNNSNNSIANYNNNPTSSLSSNFSNNFSRDSPISVASRYQYNPNPEANPSPSQKTLYNHTNDEKSKRYCSSILFGCFFFIL